MHRSCSTRLTIVFLVTAAFPLSVVKIGVRTEIYQSLIDESKPGFLPVSDSIFFSWWFGRVGDCHILEEPVTCISRVVEKNNKKMEVTGSSGPSVPNLKVTWWHPKEGDAFCQITAACDVPGVVAVLPIEGELSRSFTLPQDRTTLYLHVNLSAFLMSGFLDDADDVWD